MRNMTRRLISGAAGCVLYEMGALTPPFMSSNMLILAKKVILSVNYMYM